MVLYIHFRSSKEDNTKMKLVLSVAALFSVALAFPLEAEDKWSQFKLAHGKFYETPEEEGYRYQIFQNNLNQIEEHNAKYKDGHVDWYMGVNHFADMTGEEFVEYLKRSELPQQDGNLMGVYQPSGLRDFPDRLDLRPYLNRVRNQGGCGSCYAFATTSVVEASYVKKYLQRVILSPQNIVDCARGEPFYNNGCHGGSLAGPMEYMKEQGIMKEDDYPYHTSEGNCSFDASKSVLKVKGYTEIPNKVDDLIGALNEKGVLAIAVDAKEWQFYEGGVFYPSQEYNFLNHAVVLAGYGTTEYTGTEYWIVRNSWGAWWGEDGNIRLNRNMTAPYHIGPGVIENQHPPVYPEV